MNVKVTIQHVCVVLLVLVAILLTALVVRPPVGHDSYGQTVKSYHHSYSPKSHYKHGSYKHHSYKPKGQ